MPTLARPTCSSLGTSDSFIFEMRASEFIIIVDIRRPSALADDVFDTNFPDRQRTEVLRSKGTNQAIPVRSVAVAAHWDALLRCVCLDSAAQQLTAIGEQGSYSLPRESRAQGTNKQTADR